jgi:hypothetical protein
MATESVTIRPDMHDAEPVFGNFTGEASQHLWCASALATVVASEVLDSFNDNIQSAMRFLLSQEVRRAEKAQEHESAKRKDGAA